MKPLAKLKAMYHHARVSAPAPPMKPITSRSERELLAKVDAAYGRETGNALAAALLPSLRADRAAIVARLDELVNEYPSLKSSAHDDPRGRSR